MSLQKTINEPAGLEGRGLFSGKPSSVRFVPAEPGSGVTFVRTDLPGQPAVKADVAHVIKRGRRTMLANGTASVETVEHVLAAIIGCDLDNVTVELTGEELPILDGSSKPFVAALLAAGVRQQQAERKCFVIDEPISVSSGQAVLAAVPGPTDSLEIVYDLDYGDCPGLARQVFSFSLARDDFAAAVASARTFCTLEEAKAMRASGIGEHLSPGDVLVLGPQGPVDTELRFADEPVRHKVCDLIGDLALLGQHLRGRIIAYKSGHELNHELAVKLREARARRSQSPGGGEPVLDIQRIMRLLPHRYPFLMIDRVLEIDEDRRAVAIKNVSINEPFFQGHFPNQPVMPAVMILEAMAQLSGILVGRRLEHIGKVGMLLSLDRVKLRRAVRPGDQLVLEAETLRVRSRTGHCRCRAFVAGDLAAEAEVKFMLVDAEPI